MATKCGTVASREREEDKRTHPRRPRQWLGGAPVSARKKTGKMAGGAHGEGRMRWDGEGGSSAQRRRDGRRRAQGWPEARGRRGRRRRRDGKIRQPDGVDVKLLRVVARTVAKCWLYMVEAICPGWWLSPGQIGVICPGLSLQPG